jgi:hypothetical protein
MMRDSGARSLPARDSASHGPLCKFALQADGKEMSTTMAVVLAHPNEMDLELTRVSISVFLGQNLSNLWPLIPKNPGADLLALGN